MSSKIDKVIAVTEKHDERINDLELAKVDEEEIINKVADVADIVSDNLSKIASLEEQIIFLTDLVGLIGKKLKVEISENTSNSSSIYS